MAPAVPRRRGIPRRLKLWFVGVFLAVFALGAVAAIALREWRRYWYGADSSLVLPSGPFVTPPRLARATVWAVGDGADGSADAQALAERIARARPALFVYLGDVYQRGLASDFRDHYATVYGPLDARTAPTPGNHEWGHHDSGYNPYWRRVYRKPVPAFYAFTLAGWRFLSLNSEAPHDSASAQLRWLSRRLRAPGTCTIAFWHRPRFSAGRHGDQADVAPLWDALRGHATIVLNGHDHDLQRLEPVDGITEFVVGAGGKSHYAVNPTDDRLAFWNDTVDGALRLELRRGRAGWAFVAGDGRALDSGSLSCRPG
jgi:Calcineurin-like phosphoesterase